MFNLKSFINDLSFCFPYFSLAKLSNLKYSFVINIDNTRLMILLSFAQSIEFY